MISSVELRAVSAVGLVYITRMLGLFMILPVLALNENQYSGSSATSIGLALGIYGLMQALLQVPFGRLSDRIGRKPVILLGLALFALGSLLAALSNSIEMLIFARAIQGAGAVSAALLALLSDCSREQNRSKLMAILGISIGLSFGLAMVLGPVLAAAWGVASIFWLCLALSGIGAVAILRLTPQKTSSDSEDINARPSRFSNNPAELWRLNFGIFVLHAVQMSLWVAVPVLLFNSFNIAEASHWKWYLMTVGGGFILMAPAMRTLAKRNRYKTTLVAGVVSLLLAQLLLSQATGFVFFILGLLVFFWGFNLLEATLPSLVSRWVDDSSRGNAMGWYSSSQFAGTFVGGAVGGLLVSAFGLSAIFYFGLVLIVIWLVALISMRPLPNIQCFVLANLDKAKQQCLMLEAGILSIHNFEEQNESFVRVDMDLVAESTLNNYQLQ